MHLINTIKTIKLPTQLKKAITQPQESIVEKSKQFSSLECPYCLRKFSQKAAQRHIDYCKQKYLEKKREE